MCVCIYVCGYKIKTELLKEQRICHHPSQIKKKDPGVLRSGQKPGSGHGAGE